MGAVIQTTMSLWLGWKSVQEDESMASPHATITDRWSPPSQAKAKKFVGYFSVKEGEVVSIREALSWIKEMDLGDVDVETYSQLVFYALLSEPLISPFGFIIADVKEAASQIHDVVFRFVKRSANRAVVLSKWIEARRLARTSPAVGRVRATKNMYTFVDSTICIPRRALSRNGLHLFFRITGASVDGEDEDCSES
ncbi:uncharacterized protein LOC116024347 [Ipomoea triloba]|uniref:uncharacterized protein LOC116024347 n=1 Tax=Ipomoea triloba TaxID=35885 RepID=UPI00125E8F96|nr:uncharacterized protein LOC116024347 [Ipomoea triloba]